MRWLSVLLLVVPCFVVVTAAQQSSEIQTRPIVLTDCPIVPIEERKVAVKVPGILVKVLVKKGDVVKKDQLLAKVDDVLARVELEKKTAAAQNDAQLKSAQARQKEAQAQRDDAKKLYDRRTLSEEEFRIAEAKLDLAVHGVADEVAKQHLADIEQLAAEEIVKRYEVRSPIDGEVIDQFVEEGEAIKESEPVFLVISRNVVKVEGTVSVNEAGRVRPGMRVELYPNQPVNETNRLLGHTSAILDVKVLPDDRRCATAAVDGTIVIWDVKRGGLEREIRAHDGAVRCLATIPTDANRLVSAGTDGRIHVWDLSTGTATQTIKFLAGDILSLVVNPLDPNIAYTGHEDRQIRAWDLGGGKEIGRFSGHTNHVITLDATPDGKSLVSAGNDQSIRVWDLATGKESKTYRGRSTEITRLGLSEDGKLFPFNNGSFLQIRELADGVPVADLENLTGSFAYIAVFAPRGGLVLTANESAQLLLYEPAPAGRSPRLVRRYEGHGGQISAVDFSRTGDYFVSVGNDRVVHVWEVPSADTIRGERKSGTISFVNRQAEAGSRTIAVHAEIENKDDVLLPGDFATMVIYPHDAPVTARN